ncbi:maleylpyruvate isomerase family mycothiol-dependent enzyme [Streptomyces sp. NPDC051597]|uniref:maleylpyruvate isomerase family mycothiol-dependent enzyme n=1 Tax=Streptomyces sp. NPDC051597 TaxID=3155049 RepID=UPI00343569FF
MNTAEPLDHRAAVAAESARFAGLVEGADLSLAVPTCPGWTLADLIRHTGGAQRMFTALVRALVQERPASRGDLRLPEREEDYADWLAAGAAEADRVFAGTDLDAPMWVWGADGHARFWVRRMLFETLVHRFDAERALGLPSAIDPALARDGVDEFLVNLPFAAFFAPGVAELRSAGPVQHIRFASTDTDDEWLVRLRPDGFGLVDGQDGPGQGGPGHGEMTADATVRAGAADLLLLVYGRLDRSAGAVRTSGDEELLQRWSTHSAF